MRMNYSLLIALSVVLFTTGTSTFAAGIHGGWKLEAEKDGIRIYTRAVHGSSLKQVRAVTEMKAPREAIMQVLTDYDNYKSWMNNVRDSYVMERQDDSVSIVYAYEDAPWPVQNRYHVDRMTVSVGEAVSVLFFKALPDYTDQPTDAIQLSHYEGWWKVSEIAEGGCRIEYMLDGDPGGYIPSWLVNYMAVDAPYKTLINLRERVSMVQRS